MGARHRLVSNSANPLIPFVMRVKAIKFAALLFASAAALALPIASFGQTNADAEYTRRVMLGSGRYILMKYCNVARAWNRQGGLFFDEKTASGMRPPDMSDSEYRSYLAGLAAAMFEVCPDVR